MPRNPANVSNAALLRPEVVRNQMLETVDQMERIEMGDQEGHAAAISTFPAVNLSNPTEGYYQYGGTTDAMRPVGFDADPPLMSLDLPERDQITIDGYKEAFNPKKGAETTLNAGATGLDWSIYQQGIGKLNTKIWLTRELIAWRGDSATEGFIGSWGNDAHSKVEDADNVRPANTAWSDETAATPTDDIDDLAFDVVNNGYMSGGQATPNVWMGPETLRDMKNTDDMQNALPSNTYQRVTQDAVADILGEWTNNVQLVMVYYPRTDENGQFLDADNNIVDNADDAKMDNMLEPYDPANDVVRRNVVVGRPGASSAFFPWFMDRLTEDVGPGDVPGEMDVDEENGFLTYVYKDPPTRETYVSGEQEIGFHIQRGSNFGILQGV